MKFAIDGRYIQDHFPGIGRYTYNLVRALAGIAPADVFTILHNPNAINTRYDLAALTCLPNVKLAQVNVPTMSLHEQLQLPLQGAQLYHSPFYIKPYASPVPSIVTIFDLLPFIVPAAVPNPGARVLFRWTMWLATRTSTRIIVPSVSTRNDLVRIMRVPPDKIHVIPLAADTRFRPQPAQEIRRVREKYSLPEDYVLYVGINKPHKNLETLVDAYSRIRYAGALVIAGAWDMRYESMQKVETGEIRFLHDVNDADLPGLYSGSVAFVMPSLYEGFGLTPLEAMACGAPVICSNMSSLPEVVGDAALLVDPRDLSDVSQTLERVLGDGLLRRDLRARSLSRAREFSWERTAQETWQVYRQVAKD